MRNGQSKATFVDCAVHGAGAGVGSGVGPAGSGAGSGAELFIVEGESAAGAVVAVRSARFQAVLPLQGKPMNAWRASAAKVKAHALYAQLAGALGIADATALEHAGPDQLAALRFERVVLLMDPDADGIHIGALMLLYMQRWAQPLINTGRVAMARAPMFVLEPTGKGEGTPPVMAYTPNDCQARVQALATEHGAPPRVQAVRGLASLAPLALSAYCVDPATRRLDTVTQASIRAVIDVFGGTS